MKIEAVVLLVLLCAEIFLVTGMGIASVGTVSSSEQIGASVPFIISIMMAQPALIGYWIGRLR